MNGHSNAFLLAAAAGLTALSIACASTGGISRPPEPASPAVLSRDHAIDAALQAASGLIGEDEIQETTAFYTTYGEAYVRLAARGIDKPAPDGEVHPDDTPIWMATFKGRFYEPQGPPPHPTITPKPREPTCSDHP